MSLNAIFETATGKMLYAESYHVSRNPYDDTLYQGVLLFLEDMDGNRQDIAILEEDPHAETPGTYLIRVFADGKGKKWTHNILNIKEKAK